LMVIVALKWVKIAVEDIFDVANVLLTAYSAYFWKLMMGYYVAFDFLKDKLGNVFVAGSNALKVFSDKLKKLAATGEGAIGKMLVALGGETATKRGIELINDSASALEEIGKTSAATGHSIEVMKEQLRELFKLKGIEIPESLVNTAERAGQRAGAAWNKALGIEVKKLSLVDIMMENMDAATKAVQAMADRIRAILEKSNRDKLDDQLTYDKKVDAEVARQQQGLYQQEFEHSMKNRALWDADGTFYAKTQVYKAQVMSEFFSYAVPLMESKHRKMFEIGKAAAIAQTIVDTYAGAMAAFRSFASIPYVGYAMGAAAAASVVAVGMMRVQAIRATQFGGGGGDSKSSMPSPSGGGAEVAGPTYTTNVNVSLNGERYSQRQVRDLIGIIGQQQAGNVVVRAQ